MNRHARQLFYFGWGNFAPIFNPLAQAVQILAKYGGSLWVASPEYTFTGSDGTGAAGDGSDVGYVRDLCGNARPLTQATTGFKPKLKRVPKKLGPELVTNGDFAAGKASWIERSGATYTVSSGAASVTFAASAASRIDQFVSLSAGKSYEVGVDVASTSAGVYLNVIQGSSPFTSVAQKLLAVGRVTAQFVAPPDNAYVQINKLAATAGGESCVVDNISVREVLEWGWAWAFDGADDVLATVSQTAVTSETFGIAMQHVDVNPFENLFAKRVASPAAGWLLFADKAQARETLSIQGFTGATVPSTTSATVVSARAAPTTLAYRKNGAQVVAPIGTYTPAAAPIQIGGFAGNYSRPSVYAAFYAPAAIPDAELLIVERAMAQLAGVTI